MKLSRYGPPLATLIAGLAVWSTFHPALMSPDSLEQYRQALDHDFLNWHPPLMAIVLSLVLGAGGSLGLLMLVQCLAGVFGVTALAGACLGAFRGDRLSPAARAWLPVATLALLLPPVSPLAFYLMTFWKDAWEMVLLVWLGTLSFRLAAAEEPPGRARLAGVVLVGALCGMARHNAVVVLPFAGLFLGWELRRRGMRLGLAALWAAAPLAACLLLNALLDRAFAVKDNSPEDWILALDLAGVCAKGGDADCAALPFTRGQIRDLPGLRLRYRPGDLVSAFWEKPELVDRGMVTLAHRPALHAEYRRALREHPLLLARLKIVGFWRMLGTRRTYYFFQGTLAENRYGLALDGPLPGAREWWTRAAQKTAEGPARWISGAHLVWLLAGVAWMLGLLAAAWRRRDGRLLSLALVLALPLAYAASYLPATPVPDFRFLYPSTLWIQCAAIAVALSAVIAAAARGPRSGAASRPRSLP